MKTIIKYLTWKSGVVNLIVNDSQYNPYKKMWCTLKKQSGYRRTQSMIENDNASINELMEETENVARCDSDCQTLNPK